MPKTALLAMMFYTASAFGQTAATEPDTLHALLVEVHQLRQDIEGMTAASQRVQIALYSLQMQDAAVSRAAQRLDSARNKCSGADEARQATASDIQRVESALLTGTVPQAEAEGLKQHLTGLKSRLEAQAAEVQTCRANEAEASTQLRNDQAKLSDLQEKIARLDKALERFGSTEK